MTERLWGIVLGLLIGANLGGHILRLTLLGFSPITPRHYIPIFALGLYFVAAVLVFLKQKAGLWIALLAPLIGLIIISIVPNLHLEPFQVAMGVIEFPAMLCAAYLLFFNTKG
jgi:hypothetical protein